MLIKTCVMKENVLEHMHQYKTMKAS